MITVRLPEELENALNRMTQKTGRTKSDYVRKALERYFDTYEDKLTEAFALMKRDPGLSFDDARQQVDFWGENLQEHGE